MAQKKFKPHGLSAHLKKQKYFENLNLKYRLEIVIGRFNFIKGYLQHKKQLKQRSIYYNKDLSGALIELFSAEVKKSCFVNFGG